MPWQPVIALFCFSPLCLETETYVKSKSFGIMFGSCSLGRTTQSYKTHPKTLGV